MTKDPKKFFQKLADLCEEYHVEISVREKSYDYYFSADGIDFEFDGIYEYCETLRPYIAYELGMHIFPDSILEDSKNAKTVSL